MPVSGEGEGVGRPRRKTPDKLARAPRTEALTIAAADGQEVSYHPEEFPSNPLFQPGEIFYARAGRDQEPVAWEYLGRTAGASPQAVFARWDEAKDDKAVAAEIITRHHKALNDFRAGHVQIMEEEEREE